MNGSSIRRTMTEKMNALLCGLSRPAFHARRKSGIPMMKKRISTTKEESMAAGAPVRAAVQNAAARRVNACHARISRADFRTSFFLR